MPARRITVCCLKWGEAYGTEYANILHRAVRQHLADPHRFVCITDHSEGLDASIEVIPFPDDFPLPRGVWGKGMWPKLLLFRPGVFADNELVLYVDLDVMITGALGALVERVRQMSGLHIIREWNPTLYNPVPVALRPDRGSNSSVVAFLAEEQRHIWEAFASDPEGAVERWVNDQRFINAHAHGKHYWPQAWCRSFRRSCVWHHPLGRVFAPKLKGGTRVLVFHGRPNPTDLLGPPGVRWGTKWKWGDQPVPWVQAYWERFG